MAHLLTRFYAQNILGDILEYGATTKPAPLGEKHAAFVSAAIRLLTERGAIERVKATHGTFRYKRATMSVADMKHLRKKLRGEPVDNHWAYLRNGSKFA